MFDITGKPRFFSTWDKLGCKAGMFDFSTNICYKDKTYTINKSLHIELVARPKKILQWKLIETTRYNTGKISFHTRVIAVYDSESEAKAALEKSTINRRISDATKISTK